MQMMLMKAMKDFHFQTAGHFQFFFAVINYHTKWQTNKCVQVAICNRRYLFECISHLFLNQRLLKHIPSDEFAKGVCCSTRAFFEPNAADFDMELVPSIILIT